MPHSTTYLHTLPLPLVEKVLDYALRSVNLPRQRARIALEFLSDDGVLREGATSLFEHIIESNELCDGDDIALQLSIQNQADFKLFERIAMRLGDGLRTVTFRNTSITERYSNVIAANCHRVRNLRVHASRLYLSSSQLEAIFAACRSSLRRVVLHLDYIDDSHIAVIARHMHNWTELELKVSHAHKCSFVPLWSATSRCDSTLKVVRASLPPESIVGSPDVRKLSHTNLARDGRLVINGESWFR